ncbi:MAG: toll/interleukin-1 receptor domain-containing protein, partial [Actinomycetota bacterium]|nr:toll/interleukin-1 receptor domain-containing protein [Actinomycetota bacterium]
MFKKQARQRENPDATGGTTSIDRRRGMALAGRRTSGPQRGVFISYRREDASGFAGRLHESLSQHFGTARIFRDIDTVQPGADFVDVISDSLASCGALVVIIGREWIVDTKGRRRLDDPDDWVRLEVAAGIERDDVMVVPVLVEGTAMPSVQELPDVLAPLARRNALEVTDGRWKYDVQRLIECLEGAVGAPKATWRKGLRSWIVPSDVIGGVVRVLVAASVLVTAIWGMSQLFDGSPVWRPMEGDFNIAVAEFGGVGEAGQPVSSAEATALAQSVFGRLRDELGEIEKTGFDLELRSPIETGPLKGRNRDERARAAAEMASGIRADIVVYGTLRVDIPNQFTTEFFLSDRRLENAEELVGQHELGSALMAGGDISRNAVVRRDLREKLLQRTRALAQFIVGLSYFAVNQNEAALRHFEVAKDSAGWDARDGKEVLYLFIGNAEGRLGDLAKARVSYDQALALNPEYARARLGHAEVLLHAARADCEAGNVDVQGLYEARDRFRSALAARVQPAAADIPAKVAFGVARVQLCLSQALVGDYWIEAERGFQEVIEAFRRGNARLREMAAESHGFLGFIHLPSADEHDAVSRYRRALSDYQAAIDLTLHDERKAFFHSMRGFVFARLGDKASAADAYEEAIRLEPDPAKKASY